MSARQSLGIEGRFYTNGLELKHKLQKKRLRECEIPNEVADVSAELQKWSEEFYIEEARAIRGLGKYHLAPGYDHFYVDPTRWNCWSPERRRQHVNSFREFVPKSYNLYKKPGSAGHKTSLRSNKRRAELPEPEIFADHILDVNPPAKKTAVTPLHLSKVSRSSQWQVRLTNKVDTYSSFYYCVCNVRPYNQELDNILHVHTYLKNVVSISSIQNNVLGNCIFLSK